MTLHAPFIFDVFRVLYFSSHHFMRVYMELFRQRADVELKLEREREKGNCSNLKKKELVSCSLPLKEKFVILFGLFHLTPSKWKQLLPTILKINFDEEILYNASHKLSVHLLCATGRIVA